MICEFSIPGESDEDGWPVSKGLTCTREATHLLMFDDDSGWPMRICEQCIPAAEEMAAEAWNKDVTIIRGTSTVYYSPNHTVNARR